VSHRKLHMITATVTITILMVTAPAGAGLLGLSYSTPGSVYDVNPATGAATLITDLTGTHETSFPGLEVLASTVYATNVLDLSGFVHFGTIDLTTGVFIPINDQGGSSSWNALAGDPAKNLFYTVDFEQSTYPLLSVTPEGLISTIGNTNKRIGGLAFDGDTNVLYGADDSSLFTIDTATGAVTLVGSTGISNSIPGLAFDTESDILYMNVGGTAPGSNNLYRVDTGTGLATLVGPNGPTEGLGIMGLAFVPSAAVPEPATAPLLVIGAVGLVFWAFLRQKRSGPTPTGA
jgi:WD40 repeat protein